MAIVTEGKDVGKFELLSEGDGYFSAFAAAVRPGTLYRYRLDDGDELVPDPASRFQPEGPHGPSEVVDPGAFGWTDASWRGSSLLGQVVYELHVGTFTAQGTWTAACAELEHLAELGVTLLEIMPVADFAGRFGWGYDGVNWFAPTRLYGRPDHFRAFVDRAHALGMGVILDVVYNHFGPDGNYLPRFSGDYFAQGKDTEWGASLNFDGPSSHGMREYVLGNVRMWIDEYHLDGLRIDATQSIVDTSKVHILAELSTTVRETARDRSTVIIAENEPQRAELVRSRKQGGCGLDALWNDDYHHSAMVALTGQREAYYTDYQGTPQEFVSLLKWGYLFQGQRYAWQKKPRGTPALDVTREAFVVFLQNHDQVANTAGGERLHRLTSPGKYRAMVALTLLAPGTPMLFQGQEFGASAPFLYFADHTPDLANLVNEGRKTFLAQFPSLALENTQRSLASPGDPAVFERCKIDHRERETNREHYALHRDLLALRRSDRVLSHAHVRDALDGFILGSDAFAIRFLSRVGDRLLLVNLGRQLDLPSVADPLFAPPKESKWQVAWSSNDIAYGGNGTPDVETASGVTIAAQSAIWLVPVPQPSQSPASGKISHE